MIDLNLLESGADYNELKRRYIIFVCTFYFFEKGIPVYTFENTCKEMPSLILGDESVKIFLNPHGDLSELSEELRGFLELIAGKSGNSEFAKVLEAEVKRAIENKEWEVEYMTLMQRDREKIQEGCEQEKISTIQRLIKNNFSKEVIMKLGYTEEQYKIAENGLYSIN